MKKPALAVALAALLTVATAGTVLATHGATTTTAPVPAHGSMWLGSGLAEYTSQSVLLQRSKPYVGGPDRFMQVTVPVSVHDAVHFGQGIGH